MKKKTLPKELRLRKETIRVLTNPRTLRRFVGGKKGGSRVRMDTVVSFDSAVFGERPPTFSFSVISQSDSLPTSTWSDSVVSDTSWITYNEDCITTSD